MKQKQIALVTGSNKGIGYEVARQLLQKGWQVYLGARDPVAGNEAARKAAGKEGSASFLAMNVSDTESVAAAVRAFAQHHDHLDVLVNNAGILLDGDDSILSIPSETLRTTLETNTLGPLRVAQAFIPLLSKSASPRIINVSSGGGQLSDGMDTWAPAYCISKTALNAVTCQLAAALKGFAVNSVCPGWVRTDMGGTGAPRSVEQGADTIVWLATAAPRTLTGRFLRDRQPIPW